MCVGAVTDRTSICRRWSRSNHRSQPRVVREKCRAVIMAAACRADGLAAMLPLELWLSILGMLRGVDHLDFDELRRECEVKR